MENDKDVGLTLERAEKYNGESWVPLDPSTNECDKIVMDAIVEAMEYQKAYVKKHLPHLQPESPKGKEKEEEEEEEDKGDNDDHVTWHMWSTDDVLTYLHKYHADAANEYLELKKRLVKRAELRQNEEENMKNDISARIGDFYALYPPILRAEQQQQQQQHDEQTNEKDSDKDNKPT